MKSIIIGVIATLGVAFAAHAAYTNFVAGSNQTPAAQTAATASNATTTATQPAKSTTLQRANKTTLAAAAAPRVTAQTAAPAAKPAPAAQTKGEAAKKEEEAKKAANAAKPTPIVTTVTTVRRPVVETPAPAADNTFSNPASVAEYNFAFVDPQAVSDPLTNISTATEQAVQDVEAEPTLSPSAPSMK